MSALALSSPRVQVHEAWKRSRPSKSSEIVVVDEWELSVHMVGTLDVHSSEFTLAGNLEASRVPSSLWWLRMLRRDGGC